MIGIPAYVSTHLVRHSVTGQLHFVGTHRDDRGGDKEANRHTPLDHRMILNAQHLIDMSRKRLCFQASMDTLRVMTKIKDEVDKVDPVLAQYMVPNCIYRRGCHELKSCGFYELKGGK
jgi:hypothetical protein